LRPLLAVALLAFGADGARAVLPLVLAETVALLVITYIPALSTWLPTVLR
jgi:TRAP-type C4-dicarboxylate transport system permease large subunit